MDDKLATQATQDTQDKAIIIVDAATFVYACLESEIGNPDPETIAEFYGANANRQIFFHLERMGYKNIKYQH